MLWHLDLGLKQGTATNIIHVLLPSSAAHLPPNPAVCWVTVYQVAGHLLVKCSFLLFLAETWWYRDHYQLPNKEEENSHRA